MGCEQAELNDRITRLERILSSGSGPGTGWAQRAELAAALADRYLRHGGSEDDRERVEQIVAQLTVDEDMPAGQRAMLGHLRNAVRMLSTMPPALRCGGGLNLNPEVLQQAEEWQGKPVAAPAVIDTGSLPPELRWVGEALQASSRMLSEVARDGEVSEATSAALNDVVVPPDSEVGGLLRGLVALVTPQDRRVAALEAAVAELAGGNLLRPVLQQDLARAILAGGDGGQTDTLRRATDLLEQAAAGMEDPRMRAEAEGMLAGALVVSAALEQSADRAAAADELARGLVAAAAAADDPARLGAARFLTALTGLLRGLGEPGRDASAALDDLLESISLLPVGHPLRPVAVGQLGAVLSDRQLIDGLLANADAAQALLRRASEAVVERSGTDAAFFACLVAVARIGRAARVSDTAELAAAATALRDGLDRVPEGHPVRSNLEVALRAAELGVSVGRGDGVPPAVANLRQVLSGRGIAGVSAGAVGTLVGSLDVVAGVVDAEPGAVRQALARMEEEIENSDLFPHQLAARRALLGKSYLVAVGSGVTNAVDRAVEHLTEALGLIGPRRGDVLRTDVLRDLSVALWARGDHLEARRTCRDQLLSAGTLVLLQSGVADALDTARGAAAEATRLVGWCLDDGDAAGAVEALELGRALTLHAATVTSDVPGLLEAAGHLDLSRAWRDEAAARRAGRISASSDSEPDYAAAAADLRHRAVEVLQTTRAGRRLLVAPPPAAIGRALATLGRDALAYLVPGGPDAPGWVLLLDEHGVVTRVRAPLLSLGADDPLTAFLRTDRHGESGPRPWLDALDRLCEWAGAAAVAPLLGALGDRPGSGPDGVCRVILVPCGPLGTVPWHAAVLPTGSGEVRYACQELVLSVAASGRQLREVAGRGLLPPASDPLLVRGPDESLLGVTDEIDTLADTVYPSAAVLGPAATPDQLLDRLPTAGATGPSMIHLGCHAAARSTLEDSRLDLAAPLSLRTVLEHASGRPANAAGPTVVLAACESDLTRLDADESLTPATAFLAAGAASVVGSRWEVTDRPTAVAMVALHHFLVVGGLPAADALRAVQMWMLDPGRVPLPGMPPRIARDARKRLLADVAVWGAFGHHGW
ncbi:CHAT domain-containing protein [Pseudonocardia oroxyli]|uniref:CHAT domain-containing protein n=1 Tax=Pseudonocardia oroxyli TaxID=366584 RepID=A0A1G7XDQ7_PSEOR|nr:CHAT domain-containing protein [Pseudonocardia oroxyli]SDG82425.1 CHAT domain-containing protein [Pseudonocardia oroxyli]